MPLSTLIKLLRMGDAAFIIPRMRLRPYIGRARAGQAPPLLITSSTESHAGRARAGQAPLSTVGFLGQIVTIVGAGEVRSRVGTLASPMGGRGEAAGEPDAGRPKGPHPSSLPPPPLRDYETNPLPCSFHKIPTLERSHRPIRLTARVNPTILVSASRMCSGWGELLRYTDL